MENQKSISTPWEWQLVRLILGVSIGFFLLLLIVYGWDEAGFRQQIRWSARISFALFCMAFGASALHYLFMTGFTWWLLKKRKYIGISFATIHLIHLAFLVILQYVYHPVFDLAATTSLIGGGIAYFFVIMMLSTSFEKGRRWLSNKQWELLHMIGGYWIWSIFLTTYFKRTDTEPIYWIPVGILVLLLVFRGIKFTASFIGKAGLSVTLILISIMDFTPAMSQGALGGTERILIKNGIVYDGSGSSPYPADILIEEGKIKAVLNRPHETKSAVTIDASGLVISPGFIDIHAHGDPMAKPNFRNFLAMGVTSIALGMDGSSTSVSDLKSWIQKVEEVNPGVNILPFIGHGTLRKESGIGRSKELGQYELEKLKDLINHAFELGCWGVSMGLEYLPGYYAGEDELIAIAKVVGRQGGIISSHIRNEDDQAIEASLTEMIELSIYCPVNISHIKVVYGHGSKRAKELLAMLHEKRPSGHQVTADFYPYSASYTGIGIVFPEWAKNPKKYALIKQERGDELLEFLRNKIQQRNGPEATLFGTGPYKGKTLQDLVDEYDRPYEVILRDIIGPYGASAAYFVMDDELQKTLMLDDLVAIGSDGSPTMHHPRGYGSFAKVIEEDVQIGHLLTLEKAIYKMTGLPAKIVGLEDRGLIKKGYQADLVVFDPKKVASKATFAQPHQRAVGFNYVFVNGQLVKEGDEFYHRSGKVLLKER
ncbi:MAG: N-acyl-D-amino-acid deacylase [Saprospiraceae bacterium]|jgi:N-acyl-D-amino-acid deacylase